MSGFILEAACIFYCIRAYSFVLPDLASRRRRRRRSLEDILALTLLTLFQDTWALLTLFQDTARALWVHS